MTRAIETARAIFDAVGWTDTTVVDTTEVWKAVQSMAAEMDNSLPGWMLDTCELPNLAPPFDETMLAYGDWALIASAHDMEDAAARSNVVSFCDHMDGVAVVVEGFERLGSSQNESRSWQWSTSPPDARWMLSLTYWSRRDLDLGPGAWWVLPVDADGRSMGLSGSHLLGIRPESINDIGSETLRDVHLDLLCAVRVALFALSLMHCKNVTLETTDEPTSRQVRRARERKGEPPTITYRVLKVTPAKGVNRAKQGEPGAALTAMHLCRGHFKTYTEEAPLFGTIVGTYWWSPQLRGNPLVGIVHKDYEVSES